MGVEDKHMETESFKTAIEAARKGEHGAFRELFDASSDKVFRYLLGQLGDRNDALDMLQDIYIDLWKGLPRFRYRSDQEFWGFVFLIARRKVYAHRKGADRRHIAVDNETLEILHDQSSPQELHSDDHGPLALALRRLSATSREVLNLRYWSELSFKEIALATSTTEGAAKVRHHRALKELQTHLPSGYVEQQFI